MKKDINIKQLRKIAPRASKREIEIYRKEMEEYAKI